MLPGCQLAAKALATSWAPLSALGTLFCLPNPLRQSLIPPLSAVVECCLPEEQCRPLVGRCTGGWGPHPVAILAASPHGTHQGTPPQQPLLPAWPAATAQPRPAGRRLKRGLRGLGPPAGPPDQASFEEGRILGGPGGAMGRQDVRAHSWVVAFRHRPVPLAPGPENGPLRGRLAWFGTGAQN